MESFGLCLHEMDSFECTNRVLLIERLSSKKKQQILVKKRQGLKLDSCIYLVPHPTKQSTRQIPPRKPETSKDKEDALC